MAISLSQQGCFTWKEWATTLADESSRKESERGEQIEARPAQRVFRHGDGVVGIAAAALGIDDLDVGRPAHPEADVDDVDDLTAPGRRRRARW